MPKGKEARRKKNTKGVSRIEVPLRIYLNYLIVLSYNGIYIQTRNVCSIINLFMIFSFIFSSYSCSELDENMEDVNEPPHTWYLFSSYHIYRSTFLAF
jgi:hypothetical protein